jgi:RimJ/RimL family protein N-acetyltransferase
MITFRPASTADLSMVSSCRVREPVSWVDPSRYQRELAVGSYRPEWTWLAQNDGVLVGRAVWWALPDRTSPTALDCLWTSPTVGDRASVATDLLRAGHAGLRDGGATSLPDYEIDLEPGWREDPAAVAAVAWRQDAARRAGLTHTLERLSYAWTPSNPVPAASPRLLFNEEPDDHRFLALFAETAQRSLDDLTRRTLAALGTEAQARDDLEFYLGLPGERDWWRVGHTTAGDLVGFALPTRTASAASVGYLAVLPEHRGHGYVTDLLAEITRQHAHRGAPKITGTTDATNTPMAAAFDRGGYDRTGTRLVLSRPR